MVLKLYSGVTESPEKIVQYSLKIRGMFVFSKKHKFRLNRADFCNGVCTYRGAVSFFAGQRVPVLR